MLKDYIKQVESPIKDELETLCDVIDLLDKKLQEHYDEFHNAPLFTRTIKKDGEEVLRTNPICVEYRAMLKDYHTALIKLDELVSLKMQDIEATNLNDLRQRFKVVK